MRLYKYMPPLGKQPEGSMDKLHFKAIRPLGNRNIGAGCLEAFKMFERVSRSFKVFWVAG
jgi:hypothetical protein